MSRSVTPPDPICMICGAPVRHGELTVSLHGDFAHQACHSSPLDAADRVAERLRRVAPAAYCDICLASMLRLEPSQVFKATARFRAAHPDFRVAVGARCAGCASRLA